MGKIYSGRREVAVGEYVYENKSTIREAAKALGISKTVAHEDIRKRLKKADKSLYAKVDRILAKNYAERCLRGGKATREKYRKLRKKRGAKA